MTTTGTIRDDEGAAIAVQRITPRNDSESAIVDLTIARNEILDLIDEFKAMALLARRCPMLAEVEDWRAEARDRLEKLGNRLSKLGRSYAGEDLEEREEGS